MSDRKISFKGVFDIECWHEDGTIYHTETIDNLIVDIGLDTISEMMAILIGNPNSGGDLGDDSLLTTRPQAFRWIAAGSDNGTTLAVAATNVGLGAQLGIKGVSAQDISFDAAAGKWSIFVTFTGTELGASAGSPVTVNESGVFNGSTGGNHATPPTDKLLNRQVITSATLDENDTVKITWTFDADDDGV